MVVKQYRLAPRTNIIVASMLFLLLDLNELIGVKLFPYSKPLSGKQIRTVRFVWDLLNQR